MSDFMHRFLGYSVSKEFRIAPGLWPEAKCGNHGNSPRASGFTENKIHARDVKVQRGNAQQKFHLSRLNEFFKDY
jgi:hypothetical protein